MGSVPLHYVDLRAFVYGTEYEDRVRTALATFLPEDVEPDAQTSEGHYGDEITVLSARVERADEVRTVLSAVGRCDELRTVRDELDQRVDENCSLYLTFDKQAAYDGRVERGDGITLRAKVEAYPATREAAVENARDALPEA